MTLPSPEARRRRHLALFALATVVLVALVYHQRGVAQVGNALSFAGSLLTLWPTVQALRTSRRYARAAAAPSAPELAALEQTAEKARRRRLMAFDIEHFVLVVAGVVLMALGFAVSIVFAPAA